MKMDENLLLYIYKNNADLSLFSVLIHENMD